MRHENGNCNVAGGFCTAVNDQICEALHNAFDCGYRSALRQQEPVIKCNDLFDEDGGDIYPENDSICSGTNLPCCRCNPGPCDHRLEPVTNRNGSNDPLTLAELRKMYDGEEGPVWIKIGRSCWPAILDIYYGKLVAVWSALDFCHENNYGKTWLAYRQKPEECTV